jgi:D-aspartate ligase
VKIKSKIPNKIIIIGGNHHNGLGIIRSLGEIGCRVFFIAIGTSKSYVVKSKYIENYWYAEKETDIISILLNEFSQDKLKPIVIPSDDYAASVIDKNISKLKESFLIPNIGQEDNAVLSKMNKAEMNKLAEKHGLLVPKSFTMNLKEIESIEKTIKTMDIEYPCIVKPMQSIDGTKSDITINENRTTLQESLEKLKGKYKEVIIQEFINKEGELGIQGLATITSKEVIIPGIIEKLRQSAVAPGSTTYAKLVKSNSLVDIDKIKSLIRDLGYVGIFDMELMYSKGEIYFIELNFRNGAYGYAFTKAGINIPGLWCSDAIDQDFPDELKRIKNKVTLMSEIADFRNVFASDLRLSKWIMQFLKADVHLILNIYDIKPFIYKLLYR